MLLQEFMLAMECFFLEWYTDRDDEGPYGRTHPSNNTEAVATSMKEGGVCTSTCSCMKCAPVLSVLRPEPSQQQ